MSAGLEPSGSALDTLMPSQMARSSTLSGIGYLVDAAAVGYLAYLQLDAGNLINQLGPESSGYRSSNFYGDAVLNRISAAITVSSPSGSSYPQRVATRGRLMGAAVWGAINLVWGIIQLSNTPGANRRMPQSRRSALYVRWWMSPPARRSI